MSLAIDHVIVAVGDLDVAADRLLAEYGLASLPGGRHAGHGTGNRIVPLGSDYLELMAVVDATEAAGSPLGRWLAARASEGDALGAICIRADDLDAVAARLGLAAVGMSRPAPDGTELCWRLVGLEAALAEPPLPFFISWDDVGEDHPGRGDAPHRTEPGGISWIEVGGDEARLGEWLGDHSLPLRVVKGPPGVRSVGIRTATGEAVIRR